MNTSNLAQSGFAITDFANLQWTDGRLIVVQSRIGIPIFK